MAFSQYKIFTKNHICPWWLAYPFDNPIRKIFHKPHRMLSPYIQAGMTVMDVGCGMGFFSLAMAKMVGEKGKVIAVDLQPKMLAVTKRRALRASVANRITTRLCQPDKIGVAQAVDFVLTFWMVHEVQDKIQFFSQLNSTLVPNGKLLIAEPKMHVAATQFLQILETAQSIGLKLQGQPAIRFSRSALFKKSTRH
ncbi:MAG: class I SAM-dependent methyltransferase [Deltaproteobacteria bacterium]|nr:MAG: class I SAM-dependent methyltransferase [Deltaproteobacteria bacterium]